jgi:hypothetical protein
MLEEKRKAGSLVSQCTTQITLNAVAEGIEERIAPGYARHECRTQHRGG